MRPALLAALLSVSALMTLSGAAQTGGRQTFRAWVDVVPVDVLASQNGRPIPGLTASDFEVFDNGVLQRVQAVTTAGNVRILLLLDISGSLA